jgi:hypothetical protein
MILKTQVLTLLSVTISIFMVSCQSTSVEEQVDTSPEIKAPVVTCVGNFETAREFLINTVIQPLVDTSIVLKSTPKLSVVEILTAETFIEKDFEGIRLDGYITFEDNQLQKLNYGYFYDCNGLNDRLSQDSSDLLESIKSIMGEPGLTSGEDHTASYFWDLNDQTIALSFFNDGYSISVFPCI